MAPNVIKTNLESIQFLRTLFLQEDNFQIQYNACHERGWTDSYLLMLEGANVGYGSIKGRADAAARDTIFEFFVIRSFRKLVKVLFRELLKVSSASFIECQSNDMLLSSLLFEYGTNIVANAVLFEDQSVTEHLVPGAVVRRRHEDDSIFKHTVEPVGDYVAVLDGKVVATGGFLCHYNMPFADLYMEVKEDFRKRGMGSFLLQEVKKACYLAGRVPSARCDIQNTASWATLNKAGMRVCGFMLAGDVKTSRD